MSAASEENTARENTDKIGKKKKYLDKLIVLEGIWKLFIHF